MTCCVWSVSGYKLTRFQLKSCQNKLWKATRHMTQISPLLFTGVGCSWVLRLSSSSTLLQQLWQIHRGTSPSRDWDSEGTASASLRPGASRNKAWESAGTASASLVPWPPGSPFTEFAPQSLNSRWHSRQQVCIGLSVKVEKRRGQVLSLWSHVNICGKWQLFVLHSENTGSSWLVLMNTQTIS